MNRDTRDALLFFPAMLALAAAVFLAFWLVITFGNAVLHGWYRLLAGIGIPKPAALAAGVLLSAMTVFLCLRWLGRRIR